jgi:5-methylcytosine-specific restriction endonuclease McrA
VKRGRPLAPVGRAGRRRAERLWAVEVEVRVRSRGRCERAGCARVATALHHRQSRARGGDDTADNLIHLCWSCHDWVHAHPTEAEAAGLLAPSGTD